MSRTGRSQREEGEAQRVGAEAGNAVRVFACACASRSWPHHFGFIRPVVRFRHQVVKRDAVDQVDRVEHVALGFRHLLAFRVADQAMDIDIAERNPAGDVLGHHHHARHPEEDDVEAGDQHGRGQVEVERRVATLPAIRGSSPASRRATRQTSTRCRARRGRVRGRRYSRRALPARRPRPRRGRHRSGRRPHTRRGSGGPTRAGARCTSPGCC
jgi:hypothetical protein